MTNNLGTTNNANGANENGCAIYREESYAIVGACFEVHNAMGPGFLEAAYQECLSIEFTRQGIPFTSQPTLSLTYKGETLRQTYQADFLCYDDIILEIKAVKQLADEHRAQTINYLRATGKPIGILVNFGTQQRIQHERFVNQRIK